MKNYTQFLGLKFRMSGSGFEYYNYKLPVNAIYGTLETRYNYCEFEGLTIKSLNNCNKIIFICDNFIPLYYARTYQKKRVPVFKVWIYDGKKWIYTDTGANRRLYYLGEQIGKIAVLYRIIGTQCVYNHIYTKDLNKICGERKNSINKNQKGNAYGYMCKAPDYTCTEYDLVGDAHTENTRFKK